MKGVIGRNYKSSLVRLTTGGEKKKKRDNIQGFGLDSEVSGNESLDKLKIILCIKVKGRSKFQSLLVSEHINQ